MKITYKRDDIIGEMNADGIVPDPLTALQGLVSVLENMPVNLPAELHSALWSGKVAAAAWHDIPLTEDHPSGLCMKCYKEEAACDSNSKRPPTF